MPWDTEDWNLWDVTEIEISPAIPSHDFQGHDAPSSVFTTNDAHTESNTVWIQERRELRLYIVPGVVGQLISAMELKTELGRARSEHGRVDFISIVFRQGDYAARSAESANLRLWLSRNAFRKVDSYNGRGILLEKDLAPKAEPVPQHQPKPEPKRTLTEQAQSYHDLGMAIPPYLQRDLEHAERVRKDAENDPRKKLAKLQQWIAEQEAKN